MVAGNRQAPTATAIMDDMKKPHVSGRAAKLAQRTLLAGGSRAYCRGGVHIVVHDTTYYYC